MGQKTKYFDKKFEKPDQKFCLHTRLENLSLFKSNPIFVQKNSEPFPKG
jgi:hypothetical protein